MNDNAMMVHIMREDMQEKHKTSDSSAIHEARKLM